MARRRRSASTGSSPTVGSSSRSTRGRRGSMPIAMCSRCRMPWRRCPRFGRRFRSTPPLPALSARGRVTPAPGQAIEHAKEAQVVTRGEAVIQPSVSTEDHRLVTPRFAWVADDIDAEHHRRTRCRQKQRGQNLGQCGLAGAVTAEHRPTTSPTPTEKLTSSSATNGAEPGRLAAERRGPHPQARWQGLSRTPPETSANNGTRA